jgi:hypothetical protein
MKHMIEYLLHWNPAKGTKTRSIEFDLLIVSRDN